MDRRISTILPGIPLSGFMELRDTTRRDPCLELFKDNQRVIKRAHWWKDICSLSEMFFEAVNSEEVIFALIKLFVNEVGIEVRGGARAIEKIPTIKWHEQQHLSVYAEIDQVTPWKSLLCNLCFIRGQDFTIDNRNTLSRQGWNDLMQSVSTHHILIPIGDMEPTERDTIESCPGVVLKEEDLKEIFTAKKASEKFREVLQKKVDITLLSPYKVQGRVAEHMFFGRRKEIELIVSHPEHNYAIYGGRQSGKSSLLKQLQRMWGKHLEKDAVYIDCESGINAEDDLWTALSIELRLTPNVDNLKELIIAMKQVPSNTVLLLDEMDSLLKKCDPNRILSALRKFQEERNIQCIFAGSPILFKLSKELTGPMYNFCEPMKLGPLTEKEAVELAHDPMVSLGVRFESGKSTARQLVNLAGRFPALVQLLCQRVVEELSQRREHLITKTLLEQVFRSPSYSERILDIFFTGLNTKQKLIVCCAQLAKEMSLQDIVEKVQQECESMTFDSIQQELDALEVLFLLEKTQFGYKWVYEQLPGILKKNIHPQWMIGQMVRQLKEEEKQSQSEGEK